MSNFNTEELLYLVKCYTDRFGLIQDKRNHTSGNGLLYTAEMYIVLNRLGLLADVDKEKIKQVIRSCQQEPGLFNRHPESREQNAQDDMIGLTALAHELGWQDISNEVLVYGQRKTFITRLYSFLGIFLRYVYNNNKPGEFSLGAWLGRYPHLVAHFYFAANKQPPMWRKLWWVLVVLLSSKEDLKHQDAWQLTWLLCCTAKGKSFICDQAIKYFKYRLNKLTNGEGIGKINGDYFGNHDHPVAISWSKVEL